MREFKRTLAARLTSKEHASGAKQAAENLGDSDGIGEGFPQGLKPTLTLQLLAARLKSCAFKAATVFATAFAMAVPQARSATPAPAAGGAEAAQPTKAWRASSLDEYRKHLLDLTPMVEACAKARDTQACDPMLVGPDDRVPLAAGPSAEQRLVRFGWLRVLLSQAEEKDAAEPRPTPGSRVLRGPSRTPRRTTSELLQDAEVRLAHDLAQTDATAAAVPTHAQERDALNKVLAGRDFRNLEETSTRESVLEKLGNWINRFFDTVGKVGARAAWIGPLLIWGLLGAVCVGLVWGLIQLEKRWRIRLVPESGGPGAGAASARDWQLWLEDARKAAASGLWREAVHFIYWASISRLESKRLWPADRARTPREYLALLAPEDGRRAGLASLTGSFERIWYGGRPAGEGDYRSAEQLATGLISGSGAQAGGGR